VVVEADVEVHSSGIEALAGKYLGVDFALALAELACGLEGHEVVVASQAVEDYRWLGLAYMHTHWQVEDAAVVQDWSSVSLGRF
jgi:hypothetical protein